MAGDGVAIGAEAEVNGEIVDGAVEALGVVGAGAFVEQAGEHGGEAGLVSGVLRRAAANGELQRDEGNGVAFDEPGFEPARRLHALDILRAGARGGGCCACGHGVFQ